MAISINRPSKSTDYLLPWLILAVLLGFSYIKFFQHTYGFGWDPNGEIYILFTPQPEPTLHISDRLLKVGQVTWNEFNSDLRKSFFDGTKPGETIPIIVQRNNETISVQWTLPGINQGEVLDQLFSEWFLIYIFWGTGTLVLLLVRPKDDRWRLLIAYNYLTAVWLSAGSGLSTYHIFYSALILRIAIWLSVPVYLHLHWVFPRPLGKLSPLLLSVAYIGSVVLMIAQWFQVLPQDLYFVGFFLALLGSVILLLIHAVRQIDARQELRVIWLAVLFAFGPIIVVAVIDIISGPTRAYSLALLSLPALPLAYFYVAYRRQIGGLEVRANRLISTYLFLILLATIGAPVVIITDRAFGSPSTTLILTLAVGIVATIASIFFFPSFQSSIERHWLGISLPSKQLPQIYSGRAKSSTSIEALRDLLARDILPALMVRQFLFLRLDGPEPENLLEVGTHDDGKLSRTTTAVFLSMQTESSNLDSSKIAENIPWVQLALPLKVGENLLGYWMFGRRDPDDFYPQAEIQILQSLADQTAITLSNIIQTERLRSAYQADINHFEQERLRLALDLHDGILNRLAALLMKLDDQSLTPAFQEAYNDLVMHLREIVKNLRPALLTSGLKPAFEELIDNLTEGSRDRVQFKLNLDTDGCRYDLGVERHIFRIIQEACSNALKHARPSEIVISGQMNAEFLELSVHDNGKGFDVRGKSDLSALQDNGHYGLTGMLERSELIGGDLRIASSPGNGTRIDLTWRPAGS